MAALSEAEEHVPVLLSEAIGGLAPVPASTPLTGRGWSWARGGATERTAPNGRLLGLDADPDALLRARARLAGFGDRAVLVQANFRDLASVAATHGFSRVGAVILDLGISWYQIADAERGFSFQTSGPLDMRLDPQTPFDGGRDCERVDR